MGHEYCALFSFSFEKLLMHRMTVKIKVKIKKTSNQLNDNKPPEFQGNNLSSLGKLV